jgi:glycosyltransferase involved in cell wall biosynthesis
VVLTRQNREFLIKEKIYPVERIREYQNGIPFVQGAQDKVGTKEQLIKKSALRPDALLILTPIRIAPEKNADLIVSVASDVVRRIPSAVFLIAGDGPLYQETVEAIGKAGLQENIKLIGYHADIGFLLDGADVFLLPSFLELHSIAILEAMSKAVPVVISKDVGCNSEFIQDWENGVLLDPFSDYGWADALVALLQNESLRRKIGDAGYRTCQEKFDIKDAAKRFEELYRELVI